MQLYSQHYPESLSPESFSDNTPIVVIPGLFGSTINWRSFAKQLSDVAPVIVIDQRNHGRSPHATSNSYADMVADLLELINHWKLDQVSLLGHSMGGKVAMLFSLLYPKRVAGLAVLDIAPVRYNHSHAPYLAAMMKVDLLALQSRNQANAALATAIPDVATRMFLLQSLTGAPGAYRWRLNLQVLYDYMPDIIDFPSELVEGTSSSLVCSFIVGEQSDYVRQEHHARIENYFSNSTFVSIPGAGHWLHADKPAEVLQAVKKVLRK